MGKARGRDIAFDDQAETGSLPGEVVGTINGFPIRRVRAKDLRGAKHNPRAISRRAMKGLKGSVSRFGMTQPIVWNKRSQQIVGGHQRSKTLKPDEMTDVVEVDLNEEDELALCLALNNPHAQGEWTTDLSDILDKFDNTQLGLDLNLTDLRVNVPDLSGLIDDLEPDEELDAGGGGSGAPSASDDDDEGETVDDEGDDAFDDSLPKKPSSKPGGVYNLGPHILVCADALTDETFKLIKAQKPSMLLTDPPYAIYGSSTGIGSDICDDAMVVPFFERILTYAWGFLPKFAHAYTFCDWRSWSAWWTAAKRSNMTPKNCIIWDKNNGVGSSYAQFYEMVGFWAKLPRESSMGKKETGQRMVLMPNIKHCPRVVKEEREGHNAAKPVKILMEFIEASSDEGQTVVDMFGGSGSTLIAAARLGRRCVMVEKEPAWCDVIRRRWGRWASENGAENGPGAL